MQSFKSLPSPLLRVSRDLESSSLPGTEKETSSQMKISLINVNLSNERVTWISCLLNLKSNQPKVILLSIKEEYLGVTNSQFQTDELPCIVILYKGKIINMVSGSQSLDWA